MPLLMPYNFMQGEVDRKSPRACRPTLSTIFNEHVPTR